MAERRNIYAYTPPWPSDKPGNVPYLSINREKDGSTSVHVRGEPYRTGEVAAPHCVGAGHTVYANKEATITLPTEEHLLMLMVGISEHIYGEEITQRLGAFILSETLSAATVVEDEQMSEDHPDEESIARDLPGSGFVPTSTPAPVTE